MAGDGVGANREIVTAWELRLARPTSAAALSLHPESICRRALDSYTGNQRGMTMKASMQENGLLIPKRLLRGVTLVDIHKEKTGNIVVTPQPASSDPIFGLGSTPVKSRLRNAAEKHGEYI